MISYPAPYKRSDEYWFIQFPDIPCICTQGESMEELMENAQDVLSATLGKKLVLDIV